jgi:CheY-like chemotaxis protein
MTIMSATDESERNLDTLSAEQREICGYLASQGEQWVPEAEITRHAAGKSRFGEDPQWAVRELPGLVERGWVETDSSGHYRVRIGERKDPPKDQGEEAVPSRTERLVGTKRTILFVDDDKDWRELVGTSLQDAGYEVLIARDTTEAMVLMEGLTLSLIILDLDLGGENGLMLMSFLRENQPGVPVILFTGLSHDDEQIQVMLKQGAQQYVRKGRLEDLHKAVGAALSIAATKGS